MHTINHCKFQSFDLFFFSPQSLIRTATYLQVLRWRNSFQILSPHSIRVLLQVDTGGISYTGNKTIPKKKNVKAKWLSEEALQIAMKEEKQKAKEKRKDIPI